MIIGIDPGLRGGVAGLYMDGQGWAVPMPCLGKEIAVTALLDALPVPSGVRCVVVERLGVRPKQSAQSGATSGINHGRITGALEAMGYPVRLVRPQEWKKSVLAGTAKDKYAAIAFVCRAYPEINLKPGKCRTHQDGLADAVCLAEFGRRVLI